MVGEKMPTKRQRLLSKELADIVRGEYNDPHLKITLSDFKKILEL